MHKFISVVFTMIALGSTAQSVNGLTAPNWLPVREPASQHISSFVPLNDIGAIAECKSVSAAFSAERRVIGVDLQYVYGAVCIPLTHAGYGISVSYGTLGAWKQAKLGLAYGRKLSSGLSLAIQLNYHRISASGYGTAGTLTPAIGMVYHLTKNTAFSLVADNPFGGKLGRSKEKVGSVFTAMLSDNISENFLLALRVSRGQFAPTDILLLLNYALHVKFQLQGGISLNRANGFAGTSISFGQIRLRQVVMWSQAHGFGTALIFECQKLFKDE